jgi:PHP family Zn ribbon phosphoesterase
MIQQVGTEFDILLDKKIEDIEAGSNPAVAEAIRRMRVGQMHIRPGFDGVYGKVEIFSDEDPPPAIK